MSTNMRLKPGETLSVIAGLVEVTVSLPQDGSIPSVKVTKDGRNLMDWTIDPKFLREAPAEVRPPLIGVFSNET